MNGRPTTLDPEKRQRLLSLLSLGCSRRIAARYVGCAASTITRTAARDPAFADQIAQAESNLEIELLGAVRQAARSDRYWRAAAWLLERKNPQDYFKRPQQNYTPDNVTQLFAAILDSLRTQLPAPQRNLALQQLSTLLLEFDPKEITIPPPSPSD